MIHIAIHSVNTRQPSIRSRRESFERALKKIIISFEKKPSLLQSGKVRHFWNCFGARLRIWKVEKKTWKTIKRNIKVLKGVNQWLSFNLRTNVAVSHQFRFTWKWIRTILRWPIARRLVITSQANSEAIFCWQVACCLRESTCRIVPASSCPESKRPRIGWREKIWTWTKSNWTTWKN